MQIVVSKESYNNGLKANPLFFMRYDENIEQGSDGRVQNNSVWNSVNCCVRISCGRQSFSKINQFNIYCLCIIDTVCNKIDENGKESPNELVVSYRQVDGKRTEDWEAIINSCSSRWNTTHNYSFMELLWLLRNTDLYNYEVVFSVLNSFPIQYKTSFITNVLGSISNALSLNQQMAMRNLFNKVGLNYDIYFPQGIVDAFTYMTSKDRRQADSMDVFQLLDEILIARKNPPQNIKELASTNIVIEFIYWLLDDKNTFSDYDFLKSLFALSPVRVRVMIVKRYFHDIRNKRTRLNIELIKQFKENPYSTFIQYRYCIKTPGEKIDLTASLLCDSLITLYNTNGQSFQTFEGMLDIAMTQCNQASPEIVFSMERFIPTCRNAAVYNENFHGFIDYSIVYTLNESTLNEETHRKVIQQLLSKYARRAQYLAHVCKYGDGSIISDDTFSICNQTKNCKKISEELLERGQQNTKCYEDRYFTYEDKWILSESYNKLWSLFLPISAIKILVIVKQLIKFLLIKLKLILCIDL